MVIKSSNIDVEGAPLTKRQYEVFQYIKDYIEKNGYAPSLREISDHSGKSVITIWEVVEHLKRKCFILRWKGKPRGIELIK